LKKTLFFLTICIVLFGACSNTKEVNVELVKYEEKIEHLQDEIGKKDTELKKLNDKIIVLEQENNEFKNYIYLSYDDDEKLSWMKICEWDSVIVTIRHDNSYNFILPCDLLQISPRALLGPIRVGYAPQSPSSYTEHYKYIFIKGNNEYILNVYNSDLIEYNGDYYECSFNASALGEAFLLYPKEIPENSLLRKIYESKLWGTSPEIFRIRQIANLIQRLIDDGTVVCIKKPRTEDIKITENLVEMNFHNKGQKITVYWDEGYICIKSNETEEWYSSVKDVNLVSIYRKARTAN